MKAEHRKELQTNVLADSMGRLLQGMKGGPSRASLLLWGLVALAVLAFVGWRYFSNRTRETRSGLWLQVDQTDQELNGANTSGQVEDTLKRLEDTAKDHPGTVPTRVMTFTRARTLLRLGMERLFTPSQRETAKQQVKEARSLYSRLIEEAKSEPSKDDPVLAQEAMMGVAKADESLGDLDQAALGYRRLADTYPNSALGKAAGERADYLGNEQNRRQVQALYEALEKQAAPPAPPPAHP
jgi:hypothetical protein